MNQRTLSFQANRMTIRMLAVGCVAGVVLALAAPALAQRRRISLDEIVVEGNIQKPEAFFILPRTSLNFEDLERREDLKQRIIDSVEKAPF